MRGQSEYLMEFPFDAEATYRKWTKQRDLPRNDFEKQAVLLGVLDRFEDDRTYSEDEVNALLHADFDDHALVRRELVNFGYLARDPHAGEYRVAKRDLTIEDVRANTRLARHAKAYGVE